VLAVIGSFVYTRRLELQSNQQGVGWKEGGLMETAFIDYYNNDLTVGKGLQM
jgi:hypothetical protein